MKKQNKAYFYAIITILCWSTVATAFKFGLRHQNPPQLLAGASLTSAIMLLIVIVIQGKFRRLFRYSYKDYLISALAGFLNPFFYYYILFRAYDILPAQVAQPLNMIWPIVLVLISIPFLGQKIKARSILALFISFSGVVLISSQGGGESFQPGQLPGIFLALGSAIVWAFYWILNMKDKRDDVMKLFLGFFFAMLYLLIMQIFPGSGFPDSANAWFWAGYAGIFEMSLPFIFWLKALNYSETTDKVSNLIYISPFISLFFIHFLLGESIHLTTVYGLVLIITGIYLQKIKSPK